MGHQQKVSLKILWRFDLIWLRYLGSNKCLFVCLFFDLFVLILIILGHPQEYTLKISRGSDLIWLRYSGSKKCLFVCLFVRLFADLFIFYFNHLGTPTGIYPEKFVNIGLDLAEIYVFILIILGHPQKYTLKIFKDRTWFGWDIKD